MMLIVKGEMMDAKRNLQHNRKKKKKINII